eukprot:2215473-Amphidinium_carterae.1
MMKDRRQYTHSTMKANGLRGTVGWVKNLQCGGRCAYTDLHVDVKAPIVEPMNAQAIMTLLR